MTRFIDIQLLTFLAIMAFVLVRMRNLFAVVMLSGIFSLLCAGLFVVMDAVDVAFTEAAVGAGISTVLMLGALNLTSSRSKRAGKLAIGPLLIVIATGATLIYATFDMPHYGTRNAPIHKHQLYQEYVYSSYDKIGVPNVVTSVLASYRGYDTMGEVTVIFTAGIGVLLLLGSAGRKSDGETGHEPPRWQQQQKKPPAATVVLVKTDPAEPLAVQEIRPPPTPPDDARIQDSAGSDDDDVIDVIDAPAQDAPTVQGADSAAKASFVEEDEPQDTAADSDAGAASADASAKPQASAEDNEDKQDAVVAKAASGAADKTSSKVGPAQSANANEGAKSSKSSKSKKGKSKKKKKKGKKGRRPTRAAKEGMV